MRKKAGQVVASYDHMKPDRGRYSVDSTAQRKQ